MEDLFTMFSRRFVVISKKKSNESKTKISIYFIPQILREVYAVYDKSLSS